MAASRQHLVDLKTQAAAGAIDLVFLDESEALTHPYQLANRTFADPDALDRTIPDAVARLNHERQLKSSPIRKQAA